MSLTPDPDYLPVVDGDTDDGTATVYGYALNARDALTIAEPFYVDGVRAACKCGPLVADDGKAYAAGWLVLSGAYEGDIPDDAVFAPLDGMNATRALHLIEMRTQGVFDDPDLMAFGPLSSTAEDVTEIKRLFLVAEGYTCGARDPRVNTDYPGAFMVIESHEESELPTKDGANGPWAIVGDDLPALISEAFAIAVDDAED